MCNSFAERKFNRSSRRTGGKFQLHSLTVFLMRNIDSKKSFKGARIIKGNSRFVLNTRSLLQALSYIQVAPQSFLRS